jgi:hypothetical protein
MKDFRTMTQDEVLSYTATLQTWINEEYSILSLPGITWSASNRVSMERGLELISAFGYTRSFVQTSLLFKDYGRRIARMKVYLDKIVAELADVNGDLSTPAKRRRGRPTREEAERRKLEQQAAAVVKGEKKSADDSGDDTAKVVVPDAFVAAALSGNGNRLHLDQLTWLMSPSLAANVGKVAELRGVAASESNQAKELASRGVAEEIIKPHTEAAIEADKRVLDIYAAIDNELGDLYAALFVEKNARTIAVMKATLEKTGMTMELLGRIIKPYWEKIGSPQSSSATPSLTFSAQIPEPKEDHRAELHSIRTYFFRKDTNLTEARVQRMRELIAKLESYGVATDEYLVVLKKSEEELAKLKAETEDSDIAKEEDVEEAQPKAEGDLFDNVEQEEG